MYNKTIKVVRKLSLDDVLEMVRTPRLASLVRSIWEGHPNQKIWFANVSMAAHKVAEWLSVGDHECLEDLSELEILLDLLDEREKQPLKADEIKLQFLDILINMIIGNESPEDLVGCWYDVRADEKEDADEDADTYAF